MNEPGVDAKSRRGRALLQVQILFTFFSRQRAVEMGAKMAAHPDATLPNQMESRAAVRGAYRILNHPEVTLEALLAPHCQATLTAAGQVPLVLMEEDTTELDYTAHPHITGLGPIGDGRGRGLLLHSTLAIVPDSRSILGLAHAQVVLREPTPKSRPPLDAVGRGAGMGSFRASGGATPDGFGLGACE